MFGLCWRESGTPLGISAFGCFTTQSYRARSDVHPAPDRHWRVMYLPADVPLVAGKAASVVQGPRVLFATVHFFSPHILRIISSAKTFHIESTAVLYLIFTVHDKSGGCVCVCVVIQLHTVKCYRLCMFVFLVHICLFHCLSNLQQTHPKNLNKWQPNRA